LLQSSVLSRTTKTSLVLSLIGIGIVIGTIASFPSSLDKITDTRAIMYDKTIIGITKEISAAVPSGETLVVSSQPTHFKYFTDHDVVIPWGTTPETLVNYMNSSGYHYLLVVENVSDVEALRPIFTSQGLSALDGDFEKMASYKSDIFKIHLYKMRNLE
jgi:hypothetical protein